MYINYGDKDFFEYGCLVDSEHSDTVFQILRCMPYPDEEDLYQFGDLEVDINDSWIDRNAVMQYAGMKDATFDPIQFAIACTDYYGWDNFGAINYAYEWTQMNKAGICEILRNRLIASDNLDMAWMDPEKEGKDE